MNIPRRLRQRPRQGGLPIPYINQMVGATADFRTIDDEARRCCMRQNLCGLCGQKLQTIIVFIGSEEDINKNLFLDPPMHPACADYAIKTCPFLADPQANYSKQKPKFLAADESVDTANQDDDNPSRGRLALVRAKGFTVVPYKETEFFRANWPLTVDWSVIPNSQKG